MKKKNKWHKIVERIDMPYDLRSRICFELNEGMCEDAFKNILKIIMAAHNESMRCSECPDDNLDLWGDL